MVNLVLKQRNQILHVWLTQYFCTVALPQRFMKPILLEYFYFSFGEAFFTVCQTLNELYESIYLKLLRTNKLISSNPLLWSPCLVIFRTYLQAPL